MVLPQTEKISIFYHAKLQILYLYIAVRKLFTNDYGQLHVSYVAIACSHVHVASSTASVDNDQYLDGRP